MLDSILSLGITSIFTDMIHIHANDVNPPLLSEQEAKSFLSQLKMPADDIHLISMEDYKYKKETRYLKSTREANAYIPPEHNKKNE